MIARAQPFDRLLATTMFPLGTKWRAPSNARMLGHPEGQALDAARHLVGRGLDLEVVAHAELVLEEDEESGEGVLHDGLRAEAERDSRDSGARKERGDVLTELPERHEDRERPDHDDQRGRQRPGQRRRPLEVQLLRDACRALELLAEPVHDDA